MPTAPAASGFEQFLQKFLTYSYPIGQLIFWIALIVVLFLAWRDFRRLVNHYAPKSKTARDLAKEEIKIEDFVD